MTTGPRVVMWQRVEPGAGHSLARLERTADGWRVHGAEVLSDDGDLVACSFEVAVDAGWSTRSVRVDQTYRRLGALEWEYSDPLHGAFRIAVDDDGLVVDYEGLATRVAG